LVQEFSLILKFLFPKGKFGAGRKGGLVWEGLFLLNNKGKGPKGRLIFGFGKGFGDFLGPTRVNFIWGGA